MDIYDLKNNIYICASLGIGVQPFHRTRMIKYPIYAIYIIGVGCAFFAEEVIFTKNFNVNADKHKKVPQNTAP